MAKSNLSQLRWDVVVQRDNTSAGANTTTYANTSAWAGVETAAGGDLGELNGRPVSSVRYVLTFRNEVDVQAADLVVWAGKTLIVQNVRMLNLGYNEAQAIEHQP